MNDNYRNYQLLLQEAARLCERHGAGRPDSAAVFRGKGMKD